MDIKLNDDQLEISRQARRFFENETPMEYVRAMFEDEKGFTDEIWGKMAELGWTAMCIPEAYDGLGLELLDLAVVLEEMGRAVVPGPFFSTVMLGGGILAEAGSDAQKKEFLPRLAAGEIRGTLALHEPDAGGDLDYVRMEAKAEGGGFVLEGTKVFVPDAHVSDFLVVPALAKDGLTLFLVESGASGLAVSPLPTMDGTRKLCVVEFGGVEVGRDAVLAAPGQGNAPLDRALRRAQVGLCAECVGGAQKAMEVATEYAQVRIQFDQPIGAFQAIKHRCAQMYVEVESARSILYWAAWAQDHAEEEAAMAASVAKAYCSEMFTRTAASAIQVLGGTGFSWEHDIHFYLKRAKANEAALGDPVYHWERIAGLLAG